MLRSFKSFNLYSQEECLKYLGNKFRVAFSPPDWYSDKEVGELLIKNAVLVHLKDNRDKFNLLW
jgi:DNA-directed RNA polymerase I subunit RPA2